MTTLLYSIALIVLAIALIAVYLFEEIDGLKEELEQHRIKLKNLDFYDLSEHESRLNQLREALELKEYFDEEPLNEEKNEQNI